MDLEHMLESVKETRSLPDSIARHIVERLTLGDTGNDTYTYLHLLGLVNRSGGSRHMQDVKLIEKFLRYTAPREPCDYPDQTPFRQSMVRKLAVKILGSWLVIEDYFEEVLFLAQDRADPQVAIVAIGALAEYGLRYANFAPRVAQVLLDLIQRGLEDEDMRVEAYSAYMAALNLLGVPESERPFGELKITRDSISWSYMTQLASLAAKAQ